MNVLSWIPLLGEWFDTQVTVIYGRSNTNKMYYYNLFDHFLTEEEEEENKVY